MAEHDSATAAQGGSCGRGGLSRFMGGCMAGCLSSVAAMVALPLLLLWIFGSAGGSDEGGDSKQCRKYEYAWRWGDGGDGAAKVARLYLKGVITASDDSGGLFSVQDDEPREHELVSKIRAATRDDSVDGIWLEMDTPGGAVVLSDEIRHRLEVFRKSREGRFVFVHFDEACSGGYYIATAADHIMGSPTSWTGSIGVIISTYNASRLAEVVGVRSVNIASAENKAILDPLSPVDTNHVAILKRLVDVEYDRFLKLVSDSRSIPVEDLRPIADGRVLDAAAALKAGLIDSVGYEDDALRAVRDLAEKKNPSKKGVRVYTMEYDTKLFKLPGFMKRLRGLSLLPGRTPPRAYYATGAASPEYRR